MNFVLRVYFLGLMAFVPGNEGDEATVLILDARAHSALTADTAIEHHEALLLARGRCDGDCGGKEKEMEEVAIAKHLAPHLGEAEGRQRLQEALGAGGAWLLSGTELSIRTAHDLTMEVAKPSLVIGGHRPTNASGEPTPSDFSACNLEDFRLVADLSDLVGDHGTVDPALLLEGVSDPRIASRLKLNTGHLRTRTVFQVGDDIVPIEFRSATQSRTLPAAADSVMLEIEIEGPDVELALLELSTGRTRRMRLQPIEPGGLVEVALVNAPASSYDPRAIRERASQPPQPGEHFSLYYLLAGSPSPENHRPIPHLGAGTPVKNPLLTAGSDVSSTLLDAIGLTAGRGPYDRIICPLAQLPASL